MFEYVPIIVLFPLLGFLFLGLFGSRIKKEKLVGIIGCSTVGLSFLFALLVFFQMLSMEPEQRKQIITVFTWLSTFTASPGSFSVDISYQIDQLSILMALVVTGVGFLIHIYSIGYMHKDPGFWRFFAYMNLFIFAMLNLILADNFLLLFLGWEGVGLCSYLLIGFWYEKKFTGDAAKKAFIVNRIGDFGFIIGMVLIFSTFGSLNFSTVFSSAPLQTTGSTTIFWITLLLFIGAIGKSAQIPLFVWLPDAMAGPTPVSALIHAATMVTAGVYMVARCSILYALSPVTMQIIAVVGAVTAVFAATIGLVQNDIKKVLAYSTVSQLGYMFLAMGVAAFSAGIFHLMTHAFFKALLFLGSGAVIHAMHEEQDIRKMGGLKEYLPVTYRTFLIGAIAIAGIPPFAGFFSKDEILWMAYNGGTIGKIVWIMATLVAGLTAFYSFRIIFLAFHGSFRGTHEQEHHLHESPASMTVPLVILAMGAVGAGWIGIPQALGGGNWIAHFFEPVLGHPQVHGTHAEEYMVMGISILAAAVGIGTASYFYVVSPDLPKRLTERYKEIHTVLWNKYYVDEFYDAIIVRPTKWIASTILVGFTDAKIIEGIVNGVPKLINAFGMKLRKLQTGYLQHYGIVLIFGLFVLISIAFITGTKTK